MKEVWQKLSSRKFWAWAVAIVSSIGGVLTGDLTVPQFVGAIVAASATYQLAEAWVDSNQ